MQPKVLKQFHVEYIPAPYMGENRSGYHPIGDFILVRPDLVAKKSSGGVELPDDIADRMELAAITGVIVECGNFAFHWNSDRTRHYLDYKPQPGDQIIFEKYAGKPIIGDDGVHYRIMEDKCVGGVRESPAYRAYKESLLQSQMNSQEISHGRRKYCD